MTVKELIELNGMITDLEITVRKDGNLLLDQLNIGPAEGVKPPYPMRVPKSEKYAGSLNQHNDDCYKCIKHGIVFKCPKACPDFYDIRQDMSKEMLEARSKLMEQLGRTDPFELGEPNT